MIPCTIQSGPAKSTQRAFRVVNLEISKNPRTRQFCIRGDNFWNTNNEPKFSPLYVGSLTSKILNGTLWQMAHYLKAKVIVITNRCCILNSID